MVKRNCLHCNVDFSAKPSSKRLYCSLDCFAAYKRSKNMHKCVHCGSEFYRPQGHAKRAKVGLFCSRKCFDVWEHGKNNPAYTGGNIERTCEACGKVFLVKPGYLKKPGAMGRFCSCKCKAQLVRGENHPVFVIDRVTITCVICGQSKEFAPSHARGRKYCSKACQGKAKRVENSGEKNGRYVHGNADLPYPMGFTARLKNQIRDRHNGECALCGTDQSANGNRAMDVHHIDYDKGNLDQWNLIPLCRICHGKMHGTPAQRIQWSTKLSKLLDGFRISQP